MAREARNPDSQPGGRGSIGRLTAGTRRGWREVGTVAAATAVNIEVLAVSA